MPEKVQMNYPSAIQQCRIEGARSGRQGMLAEARTEENYNFMQDLYNGANCSSNQSIDLLSELLYSRLIFAQPNSQRSREHPCGLAVNRTGPTSLRRLWRVVDRGSTGRATTRRWTRNFGVLASQTSLAKQHVWCYIKKVAQASMTMFAMPGITRSALSAKVRHKIFLHLVVN